MRPSVGQTDQAPRGLATYDPFGLCVGGIAEGFRSQEDIGVARTRIFVVVAALSLVAGLNIGTAHAQAGGAVEPSWWSKFQTVSSGTLTPAPSIPSASVSVGANVDLSNEPGPQSETAIAINPSNGSQIVAGSNEILRLPMRGYFSADGGATWGGVDLPLPSPLVKNGSDFGSDPGVAWDTEGNVYYSYIVVFFGGGFVHGNGGSINGTELAVARSSDGGKTWTPTYFSPETGGSEFDDKPMITVDTNAASPHLNTIYVSWDHAGGGKNAKTSSSNAVAVASSSNGGRTFTETTATSVHGGPAQVIGADPFLSPDGALHVAYNDVQTSQIQVVTSFDGGQSFAAPVTVSNDQMGVQVNLPAEAVRGVLEYPSCAADSLDATGQRLYCSFMDGTLSGGVDVFVSSSADGGAHWGAPVRVSDSAASYVVDHFYQWLAVDPSDGSLNLSFYDTRNDPNRTKTDVYFARSTDHGATFGANVKVTTATSDETVAGAEAGDQYGDYEGIAALNGSIHPVWTDGRFDGVPFGGPTGPNTGEEVFSATITTK